MASIFLNHKYFIISGIYLHVFVSVHFNIPFFLMKIYTYVIMYSI